MSAVCLSHLRALYEATDDPWDFRTSPFEAQKFEATAASLPRATYASGLELGCGNGELARRLKPRCRSYIGLDAVSAALAAARRAVPSAQFVEGFLPCALPRGPEEAHDLIVLSEILYFLDPAGITWLGREIERTAPEADVIAVTWLGSTGHTLGGMEALIAYTSATPRAHRTVREAPGYRIDLFLPPRSSTS